MNFFPKLKITNKFLFYFLLTVFVCSCATQPQTNDLNMDVENSSTPDEELVPTFTSTFIPPTKTPEPTYTPTEVPLPRVVTQGDADKVNALFVPPLSDEFGFYRNILRTDGFRIPEEARAFLELYLQNVAYGVSPDVQFGPIHVFDGKGEPFGIAPIEFTPDVLAKASAENGTGGRLLLIYLDNPLKFPSGSIQVGEGYPLKEHQFTYDDVMQTFAKQLDRFQDPGDVVRFPNGESTINNNDVRQLVIGLGNNADMQRAFFELEKQLTSPSEDHIPPDIIFLNEVSDPIIVKGITSIYSINISDDPNNLLQELKVAYELIYGGSFSGITWQKFLEDILHNSTIFVSIEQLEALRESQQ